MGDSLHSSVVISIVRMSLADKNLSDGQTQLLLRMGEGSWDPCDPESRESIPELIATRWFYPNGYIKYFLYGVVPGVTLCSIEPEAGSCKTRAMAVASLLQPAVHASTWIKGIRSLGIADRRTCLSTPLAGLAPIPWPQVGRLLPPPIDTVQVS
jgi:hypothetical protein